MNAWTLPKSLCVGGTDWAIRTDFRAILGILDLFNEPELDDMEKWLCCLDILYVEFDAMPPELYEEAMKAVMEFIDYTHYDTEAPKKPALMDWEQDASVIIPAINRVAGREIRTLDYLHWWTFLGYYMEIGDSLFGQYVSIRQKKAKGQKLEKWEQDFYIENKHAIDLQRRYSKEEMEEINALLRELDGQ